MKLIVEITLGVVGTFDDAITAMQYTANSLSDSTELLSVGEEGIVFFDDATAAVGKFKVVK